MYWYRVVVFIVVFSFIESLNINHNDVDGVDSFGACANCANSDLSASELMEVRLEYVKLQILKKLRLSKKPAVAVPVNSLPMPVAQGQTLSQDPNQPPEVDDYYGRTEQKIIFPVEGKCHL